MKNKKLSLKLIREWVDSSPVTYNPLCKDDKIHIRFREYNEPMVIAGFEAKLTYLMTYLFTKEFMYQGMSKDDFEIKPGMHEKDIWDKYLQRFKQSASFSTVLTTIIGYFPELVDIEFTPVYHKKYKYWNPWQRFGRIEDGAGVVCKTEDNLNGGGSLVMFLKGFEINLDDFLFDDSLYLVIGRVAGPQNVNQKFINKTKGKTQPKEHEFKPVITW